MNATASEWFWEKLGHLILHTAMPETRKILTALFENTAVYYFEYTPQDMTRPGSYGFFTITFMTEGDYAYEAEFPANEEEYLEIIKNLIYFLKEELKGSDDEAKFLTISVAQLKALRGFNVYSDIVSLRLSETKDVSFTVV